MDIRKVSAVKFFSSNLERFLREQPSVHASCNQLHCCMTEPVLNLSYCCSSNLGRFASFGVWQGLTPLLISPITKNSQDVSLQAAQGLDTTPCTPELHTANNPRN